MIRLRSKQLTITLSALLAGAALTASPLARADVAAPVFCPANDSIGQSCSTAGPDFDQDGTCQEVACDGGAPCGLLCELAPDAGPTNPPDAGSDDAGPTPDDGGPTQPPPYDSGTIASADSGTIASADSGTTTNPPRNDAGVVTPADAGTNPNGANSLQSSSSCSTIGAGLGGQAGGGFFALGALGAIIASAARRRRKT
jgi:hypothetical protein